MRSFVGSLLDRARLFSSKRSGSGILASKNSFDLETNNSIITSDRKQQQQTANQQQTSIPTNYSYEKVPTRSDEENPPKNNTRDPPKNNTNTNRSSFFVNTIITFCRVVFYDPPRFFLSNVVSFCCSSKDVQSSMNSFPSFRCLFKGKLFYIFYTATKFNFSYY